MALKKIKKTKADISEILHQKIGYSKKYSEEIVNEFINIIKDYLNKGQGVKITGLGKFVLRDKKARRGRNPQTGESLMLKARRVVIFYTSSSLKQKFKS